MASADGALVQHTERVHVGREDRFLLVAVVLRLLPQANDLLHDLRVEAHRLRFEKLVADVPGERLLFFFQALDLLDELAQLALRG